MKKSEFVTAVLEQIRCKKVHEALGKELEAHIDDCAEAFAAEGVSSEEAEEKAVLTMGDPIETGVRLDRVHRPKFPWAIAVSALLLLLWAAVLEQLMRTYFGFRPMADIIASNKSGVNVFLGAATAALAAAVFCLADYTVFLKAPKTVYAVCIIGLNIITDYQIRHTDMTLEQVRGNVFFAVMLLAPVTCGFAFSMRGGGFGKFALACLLTADPPMITAILTPCLSAAVMAGITALVIMTALVCQGCFKVKKSAAFAFMYTPAVLGALAVAADTVRRQNQDFFAKHYNSDVMEDILSRVKFFGSGGELHPMYNNQNHIITAAFANLGIAAGLGLVLLNISLPIIMIIRLRGIKNSFGKSAGTAIAAVFMFAAVTVILSNMGITAGFESYTAMPLTAGNAVNCFVSGSLAGIFMSVCSRSDIMPEAKINCLINN